MRNKGIPEGTLELVRLFPSDEAFAGAGMTRVLEAACALPGGKEEAALRSDPYGVKEWGVHAVCRFLEGFRCAPFLR